MIRSLLSHLISQAQTVRRLDGAATGRHCCSGPTFDNIKVEIPSGAARVRRAGHSRCVKSSWIRQEEADKEIAVTQGVPSLLKQLKMQSDPV